MDIKRPTLRSMTAVALVVALAALASSDGASAADQADKADPRGNAYGACNTQGQGHKYGHDKRCEPPGPSPECLAACQTSYDACVANAGGDLMTIQDECVPAQAACKLACGATTP